jgi:hypothetical protein
MKDFCGSSQFYKTSVNILPYMMLAGGAIIGYNMKRVYDLANPGSDGDEENEDYDKSSSPDDLR